MRTIIAGSRAITDPAAVGQAMRCACLTPSVVLSGGAPGVDWLGERWAEERGIPVERHLANWGKNPHTAGRLRNTKMAHLADALVAVWDGSSPGTKHMIDTARTVGLVISVHVWRP